MNLSDGMNFHTVAMGLPCRIHIAFLTPPVLTVKISQTGTRGEFAAQVPHESANALESVNRWSKLDIPYEFTESMGNVKVLSIFIVIVLYPIDQRKPRTKDGKRPRL